MQTPSHLHTNVQWHTVLRYTEVAKIQEVLCAEAGVHSCIYFVFGIFCNALTSMQCNLKDCAHELTTSVSQHHEKMPARVQAVRISRQFSGAHFQKPTPQVLPMEQRKGAHQAARRAGAGLSSLSRDSNVHLFLFPITRNKFPNKWIFYSGERQGRGQRRSRGPSMMREGAGHRDPGSAAKAWRPAEEMSEGPSATWT
jgi:hypothetical protein